MNQIGRYEITGELGRGGMASVYRGFDPRFKRDVAVKVLPREFLHDSSFRARFEREAQTIATLEHAAIVPVYDFGEESGQPYIVMRLMTGGSLAERLARGPLPLAEIARLFARLAPALDEAHARGIIHRDLKPGNILFDQRGDAYLSDFGIAKLTEASAAFTGSAVIGTPAYMSPEQAKGERDIDGRSDLYALGAILFEALSGQTPYNADTPMGVVVKHIVEPVPRILDVRPNLPRECETLIATAMAKDRGARYQTAHQMATAIAALSEGHVAPAPARPAPSATLVAPASQNLRPAPITAARKTGLPTWVWLMGGGGLMVFVAGIVVVGWLASTIFTPKVKPTATQAVAVAATHTAAPFVQPSATDAPTAVPTDAPTDVPTDAPTTVPTDAPTTAPTDAPTAVPTDVPTAAPTGPSAFITNITLNGNAYVVDFVTGNFTPALPGQHVHFFFNTVAPEQAGVPGAGPWILYGGGSPFTQYTTADRPGNATQMCVLVANPNHSVQLNTGNCFNLP